MANRYSVVSVESTSPTSRIRYTAVTRGPDDFIRSGLYSLRHYGGDTEILIAITMCNENEVQFSRTMNSCVSKSRLYI